LAKRLLPQGTTLRVYVAMLRAGRPLGVREVQRMLGFKSPSTALYHINKLLDMGYVVKAEEGYEALAVKGEAGILGLFNRVGTLLVPRVLFYALFFTTSLVLFLTASLAQQATYQFLYTYALALTSTAAALMWYEAFKLWRGLEFEVRRHASSIP